MKKAIGLVLGVTIAFVIVFAALASADTLTVKSDTSVMVYGPLTEYQDVGNSAWGIASPAVATWVHPSWPTLTGATWISNTYKIGEPIADSSWRWFTTSFDLCAGAYDLGGSIDVTSDNAEEAYLNGTLLGSDGEVEGAWSDDHEWGTIKTWLLDDALQEGTNTLNFIVRNYPGSDDPEANPTGLIFKATVAYSCPIVVSIDIKPGSDPSCFNNDGHGVIPVAILGSADFDVTRVDPGTVQLEGLAVSAKGKSNKLLAAYEDVNGDGYPDLVIKIEDVDGTFTQGSGTATLNGNLYDGTPIQGTGDICITQ
jgi:hypothetical protein